MKVPAKFPNITASVRKEAFQYNFQNILIALSGGADSIATAVVLKDAGLNIKALHCNFHLRGEESNRDMNFVKQFCKKSGIPLEIKEFDINKFLTLHPGISIEMACRELRYEWFFKFLENSCYDRIATGHNADDNIETFFLNVLRGSGTRGLKGMVIDTGKIWRPLLSFHKEEIISFLESNQIEYIVDSSNLESDYRRNYLRNEIIPNLKKVWKGFDQALNRTIKNIKDENKVVENSLKDILNYYQCSLPVDKILKYPAPLLLIKRFIEPLGPYITTPDEILASIKARKPHARYWKLKKGTLILKNLILTKQENH